MRILDVVIDAKGSSPEQVQEILSDFAGVKIAVCKASFVEDQQTVAVQIKLVDSKELAVLGNGATEKQMKQIDKAKNELGG